MIRLDETLSALPDVPAYLARLKMHSGTARPPQKAANYRWQKVGVRGKFLEVTLIANRMNTSIEALERFFDVSNPQAPKNQPNKPRGTTRKEARKLIP